MSGQRLAVYVENCRLRGLVQQAEAEHRALVAQIDDARVRLAKALYVDLTAPDSPDSLADLVTLAVQRLESPLPPCGDPNCGCGG